MSNKINADQDLKCWLEKKLKNPVLQIKKLPGDASVREFHRVSTAVRNYILMIAPVDKSFYDYVTLAEEFFRIGLNVPKMQVLDPQKGIVIMTDFGDKTYYEVLNKENADVLYEAALGALSRLQKTNSPSLKELPRLDQSFMRTQLGYFETWFLKKHLSLTVTQSFQIELNKLYTWLLDNISTQPYVCSHIDYHSRNLMMLDVGGPGIIDFQDALQGPITYDLVSLFNDCYVEWPRKKIVDWVFLYQENCINGRVLQENSKELFLRWFDLTGLQRHLKNLGVFSRLHHRDGKSNYLKHIPRLFRYIQGICNRYPELDILKTWLTDEVAPHFLALEKQNFL